MFETKLLQLVFFLKKTIICERYKNCMCIFVWFVRPYVAGFQSSE